MALEIARGDVRLHQFAPPGVLINAELQILQFRGPTSAYLQPPTGKASFDVLKMAREGLLLPLRVAINKAKKDNKTARKANVRIEQNGSTRTVNVEVIPLKNLRERCFLILFKDTEQAGRAVAAPRATEPRGRPRTARVVAKEESRRSAELEAEVSETRDYLQSIQEQHEAANEELQAANEEVQSANEELQSSNEELETSKEELESANEELTTVNEEMANRNVELNRLTGDLINLQTSTKLAIVLLGRDLNIRRFSAQAERQFVLLATDVGRPIGTVRHNLVFPETGSTDEPPDLESFIAEVIASVREREREVRDKQGHWYSLRVRPYFSLDNKVDGAVLVLVDIDTLKRSEQVIAAARDYAENIIETVREPLLVLDGQLCVESANRSFYRTFGVAPAETVGKSVFDLGHREWDKPRLRTLLEDILPQKSSLEDFEVEHESPQFGRRTMLLNARRIDDPAHKTQRILLAVEDISRHKQAEDALREAAERFRFMAESMPQKIFTAKPDGEVDYFNPEWMEFTGLTFAQIRDWGWTQFIHPDDVAENVRVWQHSIATGEPFQFEHRFRRADGEYRWHISRAVVLKDAEDNFRMWVGSNTDVHEVKEADRYKNEFLAMLAHELRNPLAPIRNMLEILKRADGNGALIGQACNTMERQMHQMTRLIDDLLDVSRISRGKLGLRRESIELASVINHAVEACRPAMVSAGHELTVALPPQPVYLSADPTRLAQVVGNLLNNAVKFTNKGGRIFLTVEQEDEQAVIRVRDTGIGIQPEMLPRIFEMFSQVDQSLERSQGGLGIGLTLVQRLVEIHSGSVQAFSEGRGRGSEFVVRLPVMHEKPKSPEPTVSDPTATTGRRILVVDDNRDSADSLVLLLKITGNETHTAYDGLAAIEAAATFHPDVILLDIGLPKLNGYEVARRIREQPWGKDMVLVAVTGWGQEEDREKSTAAGFNGHLVKPVDLDALAKLMRQSAHKRSD